MAGRNVLYHVLYEHELTPAKLRPYAAVVLLTADMVRDRAIAALDEYVAGGGKLFAAGAGRGAGRERPPSPAARLVRPETWPGRNGMLGSGSPPVDEMAATLRAADRPPPARIEAPAGVLYNVTSTRKTGRLMVHLTNYLPRPVDKVVVTVPGKYEWSCSRRTAPRDRRASAVAPIPLPKSKSPG